MNKRIRPAAIAALILAVGMYAGGSGSFAAGPTTVGLGTADSFAVLAGSGITNTGPTTITGDVGSHPTTSTTGFASVTLSGTNHLGDGVTQGAKTALTTAYLDAAGRTPVTTIPTELGGSVLAPGTYTAASGTFGLTGTVTLDGAGDATSVYIFQMPTTLITATNSVVTLTGSQQACNVFWQVGSSATLGGGTTFRGNILALTSITLVTGATVNGRLLARNGAVTLDTNTVTRADCAAAAPPPPAAPAPCCSSGTTPAPATPGPLVGTTRLPLPTATIPPAIFPSPLPVPSSQPAPLPTVIPFGAIAVPAAPIPAQPRLPSSSTLDREGIPAWALLLALAGLTLLGVRVRARA